MYPYELQIYPCEPRTTRPRQRPSPVVLPPLAAPREASTSMPSLRPRPCTHAPARASETLRAACCVPGSTRTSTLRSRDGLERTRGGSFSATTPCCRMRLPGSNGEHTPTQGRASQVCYHRCCRCDFAAVRRVFACVTDVLATGTAKAKRTMEELQDDLEPRN